MFIISLYAHLYFQKNSVYLFDSFVERLDQSTRYHVFGYDTIPNYNMLILRHNIRHVLNDKKVNLMTQCSNKISSFCLFQSM